MTFEILDVARALDEHSRTQSKHRVFFVSIVFNIFEIIWALLIGFIISVWLLSTSFQQSISMEWSVVYDRDNPERLPAETNLNFSLIPRTPSLNNGDTKVLSKVADKNMFDINVDVRSRPRWQMDPYKRDPGTLHVFIWLIFRVRPIFISGVWMASRMSHSVEY